jgi:hypothetical protein
MSAASVHAAAANATNRQLELWRACELEQLTADPTSVSISWPGGAYQRPAIVGDGVDGRLAGGGRSSKLYE